MRHLLLDPRIQGKWMKVPGKGCRWLLDTSKAGGRRKREEEVGRRLAGRKAAA